MHRNTLRLSLRDALAEAFPVARQVVGADYFDALARDFVLAHPPMSPVLADYGDAFPDVAEPRARRDGVPYLAELMRLERLQSHVDRAPDAVPVTPEAFAALMAMPAGLAATRVRLHPACVWRRSPYPIASLLLAHPAGAPVDDDALAALDLDAGEDVLVARHGHDVLVETLAPGVIDALEALRAGRPLGDACHAAHAKAPHADVANLFSVLLRRRLVVDLVLPRNPMP